MRRSLVAGAVLVFLCAAVFGLLGPVMVQPAPTYIYLAPEWNPLKSHIVEAPKGHPPVVVFADPFRKLLRPLWRYLSPYRVRLLTYDSKAGGFLVFPMHGARLLTSTLPAGTSSRYLKVETLLPEVMVDLQGRIPLTASSDGKLWMGLKFGPHVVLQVKRHAAGVPGWNAVYTKDAPSDAELAYAATLDMALSLLVFDTYPAALAALETASELASSSSERVRVLCTIGSVVRGLLSGNLGELQSLVVYNAAYMSPAGSGAHFVTGITVYQEPTR